jgi:hypothetical protein
MGTSDHSTPAPAPRTWTDYVSPNPCRGCGRIFRLSQEAIDAQRRDYGAETVEEAVNAVDFCLGCVDGLQDPAEYVQPGPWRLDGLTAQDVANLDAAMQVAFDDGDHGMLGVNATLAKIAKLVQAVRSRGEWPEPPVRCEGMLDEHDQPACDGPDVRRYRFRTADGPQNGWTDATWCSECEAEARHKLGFIVEATEG